MCPNKAFHDQNFFPHSLHGRVILGALGSGFFPCLGFETMPAELEAIISSILISFDRFFRQVFSSGGGGEDGKQRSESVVVDIVEIFAAKLKGRQRGKKCRRAASVV